MSLLWETQLYKGIRNAHGKVKDKKDPNAKHLKIHFMSQLIPTWMIKETLP